MTSPSQATVDVRPAKSSDLEAVEALLLASALPLDGVALALPSFFVADDAGSIVGVAGLEVHDGHALLRSVAVAPDWRSRGLGRTLVERVIDEANARGLQAIHLLTTTADRYFPSFGFTTITRDEVPAALRDSEEFTTACPASATVMRLFCGARRGKKKG
jgi:amino-acid N-acetyltransferase